MINVYLDALGLGIYPPLFTSPWGLVVYYFNKVGDKLLLNFGVKFGVNL